MSVDVGEVATGYWTGHCWVTRDSLSLILYSHMVTSKFAGPRELLLLSPSSVYLMKEKKCLPFYTRLPSTLYETLSGNSNNLIVRLRLTTFVLITSFLRCPSLVSFHRTDPKLLMCHNWSVTICAYCPVINRFSWAKFIAEGRKVVASQSRSRSN